jgi:hypothetical protein
MVARPVRVRAMSGTGDMRGRGTAEMGNFRLSETPFD